MKAIIFLVPLVIVFCGCQANGGLITTIGNSNPVLSVAISPDGTKLASGCKDNTAKLWRFPEGGDPLATMIGGSLNQFGDPMWDMNSVAFHPDGKSLAVGSEDMNVHVFDVPSGVKSTTTFLGSSGEQTSFSSPVRVVAFSPDGTILAAVGDSVAGMESIDYSVNCIKLWNFPAGNRIGNTIHDRTDAIAFRPDGARLAAGSTDQTIRIYDVPSGNLLYTFPDVSTMVYSVAYSPDGTKLASGSSDYTVNLWQAEGGTLIKTFEKITGFFTAFGFVNSVAFSPDGTKLVSGNSEYLIKLWDVASGNRIATFEGHTGNVEQVVFSPDGTKLASGSQDYQIKYWNVPADGDTSFVGASTKVASFSYFIGTIVLANVLRVAL